MTKLDQALEYLAWNPDHCLFPVNRKKKTPLIPDNLNRATCDPAQIKEWARLFGDCNWGIAARKSGLTIVDVDRKAGKVGDETVAGLELAHGDFPATYRTRSPSGGYHLWYKRPKNIDHVFALGERGFGKDVDSPHYVLIPGCEINGKAYTVEADLPLAEQPGWFNQYLRPRSTDKVSSDAPAVIELDKPENIEFAIDFLNDDAPEAIEGNNGDLTTVTVAMCLRDFGISEQKALELMLQNYNDEKCTPPWSSEELAVKVANAYRYANKAQPGELTAEADFADDPLPPDDEADAVVAEKNAESEKVVENAKENKTWTKAEVCLNWVYVARQKRFFNRLDPQLLPWDREAFDANFAYLKVKGFPTLSKALLADKSKTIRKADDLCYVPGMPEFFEGNYNTYRPSSVRPKQGDTTLWNQHLEYLFPNPTERDHVLNWLAWLLQNIAQKPKHALLIQGHHQGTGKSFIAEMLTCILGEHNVSAVGQQELSNSFNRWAMSTKLIFIEELRAVDKREAANKLHPMVTQELITINDKGMSTFQTKNCFGILAMTNDDAAVALDATDRRYLVARTDATPRQPSYYFDLYQLLEKPEAVAAVAYELHHRDVGSYSGAQRAPETTAKSEMIVTGASELEQWLIENQNNPPLSYRLVTIDDVIGHLPKRLERGPKLYSMIGGFLRHRLKAESLGQQRINGQRQSVWALRGSAGIIKQAPQSINFLYHKEREGNAAKPDSEPSAAEDFE